VDGDTAVYAVLGHPVSHTLSPAIQNAAFRATNRNAVYVALDVEPGRLAEALRGLHAAGVRGVNLTAPHKEAALGLTFERTRESGEALAVNTLRREERGWLGHATDGPGFVNWIDSLGVSPRGARVLVLGAGGAARSIAPALATLAPAAIGVVSRDGERARLTAARFAPSSSLEVISASTADGPPRGGAPWDLLIRAVSSESVESAEAAWWGRLSESAVVLDLNYGPRTSETRARAASLGRRFEDGLGLLLHQGALSFEFWTGSPAPLAVMREALERGAR
jgi:shikimate dehydrogenase